MERRDNPSYGRIPNDILSLEAEIIHPLNPFEFELNLMIHL
jgi:hypothetical protein